MVIDRSFIVCAGGLALIACSSCAAHEDAVSEPAPHDAAPIIEVEPARPPPVTVAPALPELVPTRPIAHLAPLWHHLEHAGPLPQTIFPVGQSAVPITPTDAAALGLPSAHVNLEAIDAPYHTLLQWAGPLLVLSTGRIFSLVETSNQLAWSTPDTRVYGFLSTITPELLITSHYEVTGDSVAAWALADGRQQWSRFGVEQGLTRVRALWAEGPRAYLIDEALQVFDPLTGKVAWKAELALPGCGVATGDGLVVIEDPNGHRLIDAATGAPLGQLPNPTPGSCSWGYYGSEGVALAVIAGGKLFAFDSQRSGDPSPLRAFDLATRAQLWQVRGVPDDLLLVDHDAVYVGDRSVIALDVATGQRQAEIMIGASFSLRVEPVGGAAGPLLVVTDDLAGRWLLGRTETAPAPEPYVISGRLVAAIGMSAKRVAGVRVRVGEQVVKTDKRGRFTARGEAIGAIVIEPGVDIDVYYNAGDYDAPPPVVIDPQRVVLEGKGTYDLGAIEAYEVSMA